MQNKPCSNFYGRKTGRLSTLAKDLLLNLLPLYVLELEDFTNSTFLKLNSFKKVNLEIGFGSGDFLFQSALANPSEFYLGIEVFHSGIANLLVKLKEQSVDNLKIYPNSWYNIAQLLPKQSFDSINILFPDPWLKKRHHKRRIINTNNLDIFYQSLKVNGVLRFASDILEYSQWTKEYLQNHSASNWKILSYTNSSVEQSQLVHYQTRYEKKALKVGRIITYLEAIKI